MSIIPVILCGGAGSRLWPVSREEHPKPFIRLSDGQSLLQKAVLRAAALADVAEILTVTNSKLIFKTLDEIAELENMDLQTSFILEQLGRNTAPAVTMAALDIFESYGDDAIMLVLAADHLITNQQTFAAAVAEAVTLAKLGKLVTFGIEPSKAETGYGYLEVDGSRVLNFIEKPSLALAEQYVASKRFLWNSGIFCFSVATLLQELRIHAPSILSAAEQCYKNSTFAQILSHECLELSPCFANIPEDSLDYALMEKSQQIAVVPCNIGWSDIGSWDALGALNEADAEGNRVIGDTLLHAVNNCTIQANGRLVAAVGVENLIIVDTPDALLVAHKEQAQEVKQLYAKLKANNHESYKVHRSVHRPWGTYTVLEEGINFKIKRIVVKPGACLSLQLHKRRSEHWVVVQGVAKIVNGEIEKWVNMNESTFIPVGHPHRLENPGQHDLVIIEVQTGDYLGEDDIVRLEDVYGRVSSDVSLV